MRNALYHETLYRGEDALDRLAQIRLTICGAGAVGSNLVDNLVHQGFRQVTVIDYDRVEAHNVGTQTYAESDTGAFKVEVLQAEMFRIAGVEIGAVRKRLGYLVETLEVPVPDVDRRLAQLSHDLTQGVALLEPRGGRFGPVNTRWRVRVNAEGLGPER